MFLFLKKIFFRYLSSYLAALGLTCRMQTLQFVWDSVLLPGWNSSLLHWEIYSLGQWTTREFLVCVCFKFCEFPSGWVNRQLGDWKMGKVLPVFALGNESRFWNNKHSWSWRWDPSSWQFYPGWGLGRRGRMIILEFSSKSGCRHGSSRRAWMCSSG